MSFTFNNNAMPLPDTDGGVTVTSTPIGFKRRKKDGTLRGNVVAVKHTITCSWSLRPQSEYDTFVGVVDPAGTSAYTLVLPNGDSFTAITNLDVQEVPQLRALGGVTHYSWSNIWEEA